jgi:hypothetical protein
MKLASLALAALLLAGCQSSRNIVPGLAYPPSVARSSTLDIQVFRRETKIELTNTTARNFGPSILWLNARFSHEIPKLDVGETLVLRLKEFKDQYGDSFRGGGFFATERPERLALAEIQPKDANPPTILGMIVVGGEE